MSETREEQIERLKDNKIAFGLLDSLDRELLDSIRVNGGLIFYSLDDWIFLHTKNNQCMNSITYRIYPDYKEESEPKRYLSFDIDWDMDLQGGFINHDNIDCSLGDETTYYKNTEYRFKHFEFDVNESLVVCDVGSSIVARNEDLTTWYFKENQDEYKTIAAARIVFEKVEV